MTFGGRGVSNGLILKARSHAIFTAILDAIFFGEENRNNIAVKFEHVQNICDIAIT